MLRLAWLIGQAGPVSLVNFSIARPSALPAAAARRRDGRRPPRPRPSPATSDACARPAPGGRGNCGWWSRRSARPSATRSPLMPTHIEQPDSPHSRPASRKMRSRPSCSACCLISVEPAETRPGTLLCAAGQHRRGRAQILDPRIGAGADEHPVDRDVGELLARRDAHVVERAAQIVGARLVRLARRIGHAAVDRQRILGTGAPGHDRRDGRRIEADVGLEARAVVGRELRPLLDGAVELRALRRIGPALQIGERRLVRRDHAAAGAGLDRHVAERQPAFDRQRADRGAGELHGAAGRAVGADLGDDREHDVLAGDARRGLAVHRHPHPLRPLLPDRLRHQHMGHLGRADAERVGAERAVGRGVAVAADDQQAGQGEALLRPDHMDDALPRIVEAEQLDAVLGGVLLDLAHHARELGIGDIGPRAARRHVMVGDAEGQPRLGDRDAALGELAEGVERALVDIVAVDPEQRRAVLAAQDLVGGPELVDDGLGLVHGISAGRG